MPKLQLAILDDHQGIIDGYLYRLSQAADIEVVATLLYGEALEPALEQHNVDVLLLDIQVPTSPANQNPFPILHLIPKLLKQHPGLEILAISMHAQRTLIRSVMEAGASGYVLKDDQASIRQLPDVIRAIKRGEIYLSPLAFEELTHRSTGDLTQPLSVRQLEVLSLAAAYPEENTGELANRLEIAESTIRNLLSGSYLKLNVRSRGAAIAKASQMGLISPVGAPKRDPLS